MHEVGLIADALNRAVAAAEGAGAGKIERLVFAISGDHVTPEAVETLVASMSHGTLAEGAAVVVERRAVEYACLHCGARYLAERDDRCPECGRGGLPLGDTPELALTAIDVSDANDSD